MDVGKYAILFKDFLWKYGLVYHIFPPHVFRYDDGASEVYQIISDMAEQVRYESAAVYAIGRREPEIVPIKKHEIKPVDIFLQLMTNERYESYGNRLRGLSINFSELDIYWRDMVANEGDSIRKPDYKSIW